MLDLLIKNVLIADGSKKKAFIGDIGILNGMIESVGPIVEAPACRKINAGGKIAAPGFIDMHSHADLAVLNDPSGRIKLQQGVTTEIFGNCGFSAAPVSENTIELLKAYSDPIMGSLNGNWSWKGYDEYAALLKRGTFGHNIGGFVGNGALRVAVKGFDASPMTQHESDLINGLLEEALQEGALGLSMGLMYAPENYFSRAELISICKVLKKYNAILTVHMRGEGNNILKSINEVIQISNEAEVPLHISHFKAAGKGNWNIKCEQAIELIEKARSNRRDITCDVYPYTAGSSILASLLPPWCMEGGIQKAIERIMNPKTRRKILNDLYHESDSWDNLVLSTGWEAVSVCSAQSEKNKVFIGKNIADIASLRGESPEDCALNLLAEESGNVGIVFFHMSEQDMIKIMQLDYSIIISDSLYSQSGIPHPRLYSTFPRLFARYVRDKKVLGLEEAVRKVTSMPAERIGLKNRGYLKKGYTADITVFDLENMQEHSTYMTPDRAPEGIEHIIVGGEIAFENGKLTGIKNGSYLERYQCRR